MALCVLNAVLLFCCWCSVLVAVHLFCLGEFFVAVWLAICACFVPDVAVASSPLASILDSFPVAKRYWTHAGLIFWVVCSAV
jgi:hypothetical protein